MVTTTGLVVRMGVAVLVAEVTAAVTVAVLLPQANAKDKPIASEER